MPEDDVEEVVVGPTDDVGAHGRVPSPGRRFVDAHGGGDGVDWAAGTTACSGDLDAGDRPPPQTTATAGASASALPLFVPQPEVTVPRPYPKHRDA